MGDTDSHPRGRKVQDGREDRMLSKQRTVTAVHTVDLATSFVAAALQALFPLAFLVDSLERGRRTHFHHFAIPFCRFSCVRIVRKCRRCATEMHRQVGVALREYVAREANIMLARSMQERRIEAVGRNFWKILARKDFRDRTSFDGLVKPGILSLFLSEDFLII